MWLGPIRSEDQLVLVVPENMTTVISVTFIHIAKTKINERMTQNIKFYSQVFHVFVVTLVEALPLLIDCVLYVQNNGEAKYLKDRK